METTISTNPNRVRESLRDELRTWREREGLTQAEAAEFLGISIHTVIAWELGRRRPQGVGLVLLRRLILPKSKTTQPKTKRENETTNNVGHVGAANTG